MMKVPRQRQNRYVVLSGLPCAGKTTLGRWLSKELGMPFFPREELMTILFDEVGWNSKLLRHRLRRVSYNLYYWSIRLLLRQRRPFIIASCFGSRRPQAHARILRQLQRATRAEPIQFYCWARFSTLAQRHLRRVKYGLRHPGWRDKNKSVQVFQRQILSRHYSPQAIGGTVLSVDTSGYWRVDRAAILRQIRAALRE